MSCTVLNGQNLPQFSLVHEAPLYLNPALHGNMDGVYRGGILYRNQWNSLSVPFETTLLYADIKSTPSWLNNRSIAYGIQFYNDRLGNGGLVQNNLAIGAAVPIFLDAQRKHLLNSGVQIVYHQFSLDASKLNFESGFDFVSGRFSGINPLVNSLSSALMDCSLGLDYQFHPSDEVNYQVGIAFKHLFGANYQLAGNSGIPAFFSTGVNYYFKLSKKVWENVMLHPHLTSVYQNGQYTTLLGSEASYALGRRVLEKVDLRMGIHYRWKDAFVFSGGINHENFTFLLAYDYTLSQLNQYNKGMGGFEFSINYANKMFKGYKGLKFIQAPTRLF